MIRINKNFFMSSQNILPYIEVKKITERGDLAKLEDLSSDPVVLVNSGTGKEISKKARVDCFWSRKGFYLYYKVDDDHIWGTYKKDDDPIYEEEVVEVFLGYGEEVPKNYFEFQFSPDGVKFDAKISNPTGSRHDKEFKVDVGWNCKDLKFVQKVENDKKIGETISGVWKMFVYIPWKSIFPKEKNGVGTKLRANFFRIDGYPEQNSFQSWSPTYEDPPNFHVPAKFGFIKLI